MSSVSLRAGRAVVGVAVAEAGLSEAEEYATPGRVENRRRPFGEEEAQDEGRKTRLLQRHCGSGR
jgi:hypothetical protein